jgi:mono/diheme cytochrome c family protein
MKRSSPAGRRTRVVASAKIPTDAGFSGHLGRLPDLHSLFEPFSWGTIVDEVHDLEMSMFRTIGLMLVIGTWATAAAAQDAAAVQRGQKVYAEQRCSICHSVGTAGNRKGPLDEVGSKLSAAEIHEWIVAAPAMAAKTKAERKPAMKAYSTLPQEAVDALVAYLQTLQKK